MLLLTTVKRLQIAALACFGLLMCKMLNWVQTSGSSFEVLCHHDCKEMETTSFSFMYLLNTRADWTVQLAWRCNINKPIRSYIPNVINLGFLLWRKSHRYILFSTNLLPTNSAKVTLCHQISAPGYYNDPLISISVLFNQAMFPTGITPLSSVATPKLQIDIYSLIAALQNI